MATPARAHILAHCPGGILRTPAPGHPSAIDGELWIPILVGRLKDPERGTVRTYREADLLAEAIAAEMSDPLVLRAALAGYAAHLVATAPTPAQRLRGAAYRAYSEQAR
jgi:hypothetical protein